MNRMTIPSMSWVLVCDGSKALLFQNVGDSQAINLRAVEVRIERHPPAREGGTDRPGRTIDSMDGSRSSTESKDWHEAAEAEFVRALVDKLDETTREHRVKHLTVVAPPRALAVLRKHYTAAVRKVVSSEISKDLVKLPTIEIEAHLAAMSRLP
jgi:protein required for attachment to host cells